MGFDKGLDFSKIKSFSVEGGVVWKDDYYKTKTKKYNKSTKRQIITPQIRRIVVDCIKNKLNYEDVVRRLKSNNLSPVKLAYWDMAKRVFSYLDINNETDVEGWILKPKDIKSYMKG